MIRYDLKYQQQTDGILCYLCSNTVFQPSQALAKTLTCTQKTGSRQDPRQICKEREREKLSLTPYLAQMCRTRPISCAKGELLH